MGYQGSLMRLAVPDKLLRLADKITGESVAVVRYVGGTSPGFSKVRGGSCGFGTTQGGTSGPAEYIAAEDVFNTKWEAMATGIELGVNEQQSLTNSSRSSTMGSPS